MSVFEIMDNKKIIKIKTSVITTAPAANVTMSFWLPFNAVMKMRASTNCIANITKNRIPRPIVTSKTYSHHPRLPILSRERRFVNDGCILAKKNDTALDRTIIPSSRIFSQLLQPLENIFHVA